jgi:hypothetical protein
MAGVFVLNFGVEDWPNDGPAFALNFAPMLLAPGIGLGAHFLDVDPRPAYGLHGASMMGFDLFLVGMLIDGRNEQDGVRAGPTAWTLGALGAIAGGFLGSTEIDNKKEGTVFYAAPAGGLVVGGLIIGGLAAVASGDSNKAFQRVVMGAAGGLAVGLAGSLVYAFTNPHGERAPARVATPQVSAGPDSVMVSYGGAF